MSQESKHRLRRRDSRTLRVPRGWWERDQRGTEVSARGEQTPRGKAVENPGSGKAAGKWKGLESQNQRAQIRQDL